MACIEWIEPLMAAGNWMPELVEMAGGRNLFGTAGKHSPWMTWTELRARDPDVIVVLRCGFEEGSFRLAGTKTEGITPGEYRVTVSKKDWPPGMTPPDPTKMSFASVLQKRATVPLKYAVQDKTPLHVTVPRGGITDVHLVLEK